MHTYFVILNAFYQLIVNNTSGFPDLTSVKKITTRELQAALRKNQQIKPRDRALQEHYLRITEFLFFFSYRQVREFHYSEPWFHCQDQSFFNQKPELSSYFPLKVLSDNSHQEVNDPYTTGLPTSVALVNHICSYLFGKSFGFSHIHHGS